MSSRGPDEINCLRKFRILLTRANNLMAQISPDTHFTQAPLLLFTSLADIIWMRGKFHENLRIVAIACARTRTDRVRKVFQVPTRSRVSPVLACVCLKSYASIRVCIHICIRNLQSLEILLVVPQKMYDALLLKASKRKFQCLDISPCSALRIHPRPSSFRNTVTFSKPPSNPEGGYKCK